MEKIKKFFKDKENIQIILRSLLIVVLIVVIIFLFTYESNNKKELEDTLEEMGRSFYEDHFYDGISEDKKEETLSKYVQVGGIKIDLDNLSRYSENKDKIEMFVNSDTDEECNKTETKVVITPKKDYGKKDYDIEVILECGFEE